MIAEIADPTMKSKNVWMISHQREMKHLPRRREMASKVYVMISRPLLALSTFSVARVSQAVHQVVWSLAPLRIDSRTVAQVTSHFIVEFHQAECKVMIVNLEMDRLNVDIWNRQVRAVSVTAVQHGIRQIQHSASAAIMLALICGHQSNRKANLVDGAVMLRIVMPLIDFLAAIASLYCQVLSSWILLHPIQQCAVVIKDS